FGIDALRAKLLGQDPGATRAMRGAILDPAPGEVFIVDVAPVAQLLDYLIDHLVGRVAPAKPLADFAFGTRSPGEVVQGRAGGAGELLACHEAGEVGGGELLAN